MSYPLESQLQTYWCWAAVAASVRAYFQPGSAVSQCQVASNTLDTYHPDFKDSGHDCCQDPGPCNIPYYLDLALTTLGHLNVVHPFPLSWNDVRFFIKRSDPVCALLESAASGHYVVISNCFRAASGVEYLLVDDPGDRFLGAVQVRYETFLWDYQGNGYQWTGTFLVQA
ncbi:MAG: hypothetical protein J0L64_26540 [Acidobacteria bacterium]|nr:hypothetical protein [Acidobacteriota bacterium]